MIKDAEENYLEKWLWLAKTFKKKRPFSEEKLTVEEFSEKYWMRGEVPYQYHEITIEDGRNELEQLMINNIRELKNRETKLRKMILEKIGDMQQEVNEMKGDATHIRKATWITFIMCAVSMTALVFTVIQQIRRCRRNTRSS